MRIYFSYFCRKKGKVFHSGAGRYAIVKMHTMSLYESGDSSGKVSLLDMKNGSQQSGMDKDVSIDDIAYFVVRGGWPENIGAKRGEEDIFPKEYINIMLNNEISSSKKRNKKKMSMILKSLSRNETTYAPMSKILLDISEDVNNKEESKLSRVTLYDYVDKLNLLYLIEDQEPYCENVRSRVKVGKVFKHHFCDASIPSSILGLNSKTLLNDMRTFGLLFESLVVHDLNIYMEYLGGKVYCFNEYTLGVESDAVLEFDDGEYALVEVKLGCYEVEDAKKSLLKVKKIMTKPPAFMLILVGVCSGFYQDKENGIYIAPLTSLKP